jgi:inter-alpha-trypsin inhibitor heavy chain H1
LPLYAKRLIFVIDISGSMNGPRILAAKRELAQAIERLKDDVAFGIVVFNSQVQTWQKRLVPATAVNKRAAGYFIEGLGAGGMTASYDALHSALQYDGEAVYFLTDGAPTAGKIVDPGQIENAITQINRGKRMTIHCIGIGAGPQGGPFDLFLKSLADRNYGDYRRVDQ